MPLKTILGLAASLLPALHAAAQGISLALELRAEVAVAHARVTLADLAVVRAAPALAERAAAIEIGRAPLVGYVERYTRAQLEQLLRRRAGVAVGALDWSGAAAVSVRRKAQLVDGAALASAAGAAVSAGFGARYPGLRAQPAAAPAAVEVPAGDYQLRARPLEGAALAARIPVWIDVWADGALYRSVVVPVALAAPAQVYVARHPIGAGSTAGPDDFEVRGADLAASASATASAPVPAGAPLAGIRLRQPLRAGEILTQDKLPVAGTVLRGDRVRLVLQTAGIGLETGAVALAEGAPGQLVAVRTSLGADPVTGRVSQAGTVVLE